MKWIQTGKPKDKEFLGADFLFGNSFCIFPTKYKSRQTKKNINCIITDTIKNKKQFIVGVKNERCPAIWTHHRDPEIAPVKTSNDQGCHTP
jgi:hypothetical protein